MPLWGETNHRLCRWVPIWEQFEEFILDRETLYIKFRNGGLTENLTFATLSNQYVLRKKEVAYFQVSDVYEVRINVPTSVNELTYDYWIPNTEGGYNNKWVIEVSKNGAPVQNTRIDLDFEEAYEDYNEGDIEPVFMNIRGRTISYATTNDKGRIERIRFGWQDEPGRVGNVYRIRAKVFDRKNWVDAKEKDYLGVYDKRMLDIAQTYCNNEDLADWICRDCEPSDPPVTDAVPYSFGAKDALEHYNADMNDWRGVMNNMIQAKAEVNDNMQVWKGYIDSRYVDLFSGELDQETFYSNMLEWRTSLKEKLDELYPSPNPVEMFNDDVVKWRAVLLDMFGEGFPTGPSQENPEILAQLKNELDETFVREFPYVILREWNTTLAYGGLWVNYRIDKKGNMNTVYDIKENCYRARLRSADYTGNQTGPPYKEYHTSNWTGIDCSGFLQRAAHAHTALPDLSSGRFRWMGTGAWPNARNCNHIENGLSGTQYSEFVGRHPGNENYQDTQDTYNKVAPGYVILKSGHVAIVQYVLGKRGNNDPADAESRDDGNIYLLQAIGGKDGPGGYSNSYPLVGGRVTDAWTWSDMPNSKSYSVRRLLP